MFEIFDEMQSLAIAQETGLVLPRGKTPRAQVEELKFLVTTLRMILSEYRMSPTYLLHSVRKETSSVRVRPARGILYMVPLTESFSVRVPFKRLLPAYLGHGFVPVKTRISDEVIYSVPVPASLEPGDLLKTCGWPLPFFLSRAPDWIQKEYFELTAHMPFAKLTVDRVFDCLEKWAKESFTWKKGSLLNRPSEQLERIPTAKDLMVGPNLL
jgi:hypothetical protein